jgi:hypothetical protein
MFSSNGLHPHSRYFFTEQEKSWKHDGIRDGCVRRMSSSSVEHQEERKCPLMLVIRLVSEDLMQPPQSSGMKEGSDMEGMQDHHQIKLVLQEATANETNCKKTNYIE